MAVKVTMIGGGAASFVPPLLRKFIQSEELGDSQLTLMDVDAGRLETMVKLAEKLIESESSPLRVSGSLDQRESLRDADFVIAAISVGGMDAWADDIEIPGRYGIFMNVSDSVGPGGIFRTLRNAPVLESVARDVAEVAPGARIFNYTNPAPVEALAMLTVPGAQVTSLCSCTHHPASVDWLAASSGRRAGAGRDAAAGRRDQPLRRGHRATPSRRPRRARPGTRAGDRADRQVRARDLRRAAVLLAALDRVLPADAAPRRGLRGPRPGACRCGTGSPCTTWTSSAPATTSSPS